MNSITISRKEAAVSIKAVDPAIALLILACLATALVCHASRQREIIRPARPPMAVIVVTTATVLQEIGKLADDTTEIPTRSDRRRYRGVNWAVVHTRTRPSFRLLPLASAGQAADCRVEALHLHASTGSSSGRSGHASSVDLPRKLSRRTAERDVLRAVTRHKASPGRSVAGGVRPVAADGHHHCALWRVSN
jgi:hypothetical protein